MSTAFTNEPSLDPGKPSGRRARLALGDRVFSGAALGAGLVIMAALAGVFVFLLVEGYPGLSVASSVYNPAASFLGLIGPLIFGTVLVAVIALIIAVPFSIAIALFISVYAPRRLATPVGYLVDLLAAVPSVVFGLWGITVLAPRLVPAFAWLSEHLGFLPFFKEPISPSGGSVLTIGVVLAIMILPIITAITREVFAQTPRLHQEAALALGATKWEVVRLTIFPYARSGMVSAVMLGLGRALGETMAVKIILSGHLTYSFNLVTDATSTNTVPAYIVSKFGERSEDTLHVLIAAGLVLFAITFLVNFAARSVVARAERKLA